MIDFTAAGVECSEVDFQTCDAIATHAVTAEILETALTTWGAVVGIEVGFFLGGPPGAVAGGILGGGSMLIATAWLFSDIGPLSEENYIEAYTGKTP